MDLYDFKDLFPEQMLGRGYFYFTEKKIKLEYTEKGVYHFSSEGQSIYQVTVELDNDYDIIAYSCSCPYHQSECKHVAAALFLLSQDLLDEEHEEMEDDEAEEIFMNYRETEHHARKLYDGIRKYIGKRPSFRRFEILCDQYRENSNLLLSCDDSGGTLQSVLREIFDILEYEVVTSIQYSDSNIEKKFNTLFICAKGIHSDFSDNFYPILIHFGYNDLFYNQLFSFFEQRIKVESKKKYGIYSVEILKELQYDMIKRFKPVEVEKFLLSNQQYNVFYMEYADLIAKSNIYGAIDYLNKGIDIFEESGYVSNINRSLLSHYITIENWSEVKRLGVDLIETHRFELFYSIKTYLNKTDWKEFVNMLLEKNRKDTYFLAMVYREEKMFELLLEAIKEAPYLILSYNSFFDNLFVDERNVIYSKYLLNEITNANTRNQYRKLAWMINNYMKAFPENYIDVSSIAIDKYPKRTAMIDEFQKIVIKRRK